MVDVENQKQAGSVMATRRTLNPAFQVRVLTGLMGRWCNGSRVASKPTSQGSIPWRPVINTKSRR